MRGLFVTPESIYLIKLIIKRQVGSWAPKLEWKPRIEGHR